MTVKVSQESIEKVVARYINNTTPGVSLLVGHEGKVLLKRGFGMSDIEKGLAVTPENSFIIASVTKQFTDMAVMMLKEKGLLDYDETIEKYFPDFPDYKRKVTIRHLMAHTSGIKEYFNNEFEVNKAEIAKASLDDMLRTIRDFGDLDFEPDTKYSYCNSAYVMLGALIQKVSDMEFGEFLKEKIFRPLGMNNSAAPSSPEEKFPELTAGYKEKEDGSFEKCAYDMLAIGWADGNIISTVDDLFLWHNALYTDRLVKKETLEEAFKSHKLKCGTNTNYGFGWFIDEYKGRRQYWHTGGTVGYISRFSRFIDENTAIIMLTNYEGIKRDELFFGIADTIFDE